MKKFFLSLISIFIAFLIIYGIFVFFNDMGSPKNIKAGSTEIKDNKAYPTNNLSQEDREAIIKRLKSQGYLD